MCAGFVLLICCSVSYKDVAYLILGVFLKEAEKELIGSGSSQTNELSRSFDASRCTC